jgi:hypothetical protein
VGYLENCVVGSPVECIAGVGRMLLDIVGVLNAKTVPVSDAGAKVANEFEFRRSIKVGIALQSITESQ